MLDTHSFNVEASFIKAVRAVLDTIAAEYNALFGTSITISMVTEGQILSYPGVRLKFYSDNAPDGKRMASRCFLSLYTLNTMGNPDSRQNALIRRNILTKLGFKSTRNKFNSIRQTYDYVADSSGSTIQLDEYEVTIESRGGWEEIDADEAADPTVKPWGINFKLRYR